MENDVRFNVNDSSISRLSLTGITPTAVVTTAVILLNEVSFNQFRCIGDIGDMGDIGDTGSLWFTLVGFGSLGLTPVHLCSL